MDIYRYHGSMSCMTSHVYYPSSVLFWSSQCQEPSLVVATVCHRKQCPQLPTLYTNSTPTDSLKHNIQVLWSSTGHRLLVCQTVFMDNLPTEPVTHTIMGVFSTTVYEETIFFGLLVSVVASPLSWQVTMDLCDYMQHYLCTCSQSSCHYVWPAVF